MNCDKIQQQLAEYWAGTISVKEHRAVDAHLESCDACRAEAAQLGRLWNDLELIPAESPGPQMRSRFYEMLEAYRGGIEEKAPAKAAWWTSWLHPWPLAGALAMLAVGFFAGRLVPSPNTASKPPAEENAQISQLRGEVNSMRQMMALSLLQQTSASDRLKGVTFANRVDKSDREVVTALLDTVKSDPNVNVRLAAVDAFKHFGSDHAARHSLLEAVRAQESPLVQIAIIELLVDLNDQSASKTLNTLAGDAKLQKEVQERARWAVTELH